MMIIIIMLLPPRSSIGGNTRCSVRAVYVGVGSEVTGHEE